MGFVKGYLSTSSAGVSEIPLFDEDGNSVVISESQRLHITNLSINSLVTQVGTVFSDNNDDDVIDSGEELAVIATLLDAVISDDHSFDGNPIVCGLGGKPHINLSAASATIVTLIGYIRQPTIYNP